ncbi:carbohydrate ABC transporter permease [Paenibacillus mucilaginosus]|uniref:Binding-protein-dependent transport systems inner membrane component n=2 Tax=Paenibacillus mucilaginosus TaxID=61624 RepID=H6NA75_9BACL|nr:carbohydrate ABC transporter permease [Paenibacillus mucilaginosus]AEI40282.1 binding-protein-dependent transport systems inner membrane component [Paenibacillus mucilaginosus KNP414]AFC28919.1 binding-protein-dependent transport systems inner membrane component [Paenibacillus mucilaginosus 3016]MCG7213353.1 carbohydrate ABC transporter permease [Paenibacillus mucilaginosus]WDM29496.1 carbohydrate ABC transporter permease [Paenibacillus mucilaginosus]WFA17672.1 carbohydrate ABC transporter 
MNKETVAWRLAAHTVLILFSLTCFVPFVLLTMSSITDEQSILQHGYSFFPKDFSFEAYEYLWQQSSLIFNAYGITVLITVVGTAASLLITSLLAYPLSRRDLPGGTFFAFLVFFTLLFNGGLVPTYLVYTQVFEIKNTLWALIIPALLMKGFNVLLMRTFFMTTIPVPVLESASIDGASEFKLYYKIVLPLSLPIMATVGLFQALAYWNDWNNGLIYVTNPKLFSLQNVLNRLMSDIQFLASNSDFASNASESIAQLPSETFRMAIAVIAVVPILIAYPFFQKYFVKGMTIGAVKG